MSSLREKILKAMRDDVSDGRNHEAYISCGTYSTTSLKTGSAMLNNALSACGLEKIRVAHSVSSDHEFTQTDTNKQPLNQKDANDKFYWDWSVEGTKVTSEIGGVEADLTATYKYIQKSDGSWSPITLADDAEITHDDFTNSSLTDYEMYGFISTNTEM